MADGWSKLLWTESFDFKLRMKAIKNVYCEVSHRNSGKGFGTVQRKNTIMKSWQRERKNLSLEVEVSLQDG